ncbi:galactokinase [Conchiformibius steedae]|uniref:galactokinase n=1 Tax=Conchiformibius steedae TaxID=153493 RepID=UPI0021AB1185|nr:galactokinase [Conchiformibius steedae]
MQQTIVRHFTEQFSATPALTVRAPGRVNLIGEHTDYNQGFVLPCAIDFAAYIALAPNHSRQVRVYAADYREHDVFSLEQAITPHPTQIWSNYVRGVIWALAEHGFSLPSGIDLAITGNVPQGAGLSSSAALEVGVAKAVQEYFDLQLDAAQLAGIAQFAENRFVGCQCGIMDQLASAKGRRNHALLIDCRNLHTEPIPLPEQLSVAIIHSHVRRGLVDSEYNLRRAQCEAAAQHFGVASLRDLTWADFEAGKQGLDDTVARRARYIIGENQRTLDAAKALRHGDTAALGRLMAQSHAGMRDEFNITHPAVDALVELAGEVIGTQGGARMTGGGFGGCVVALLPHEQVGELKQHIAKHYHARSGLHEEIFVCTAQDGAAPI